MATIYLLSSVWEREMKKEDTPPKGYPKKCKCGGNFKMNQDEWASRVRCDKCNDYYDL